MTEDEIRRLLGGYATDALTEGERQILFEAALDNQDLFDALQNEDALRELLADPLTRAQARMALSRAPARAGFSGRRWALGVAVPALVAVVLIVAMNRGNAPRQIAQVAGTPVPAAPPALKKQSRAAPAAGLAISQHAIPATAPVNPISAPAAAARAPAAPEPATPAPAPAATGLAPAATGLAPATPAPALAATAPARAPLQLDAMAGLRAAAPAPIPEAVRQQFASGLAANAPLYQGPLVRYALLRGGPDGGDVRVEVTPGIAGYLALYTVDASGESKRVYPEYDAAARVAPDIMLQIPGDPIKIAGTRERLRLVFLPATAATSIGTGQLAGAVGGAVEPAVADRLGSAPSPLVVDIPLVP
jgi:hypothetical protein